MSDADDQCLLAVAIDLGSSYSGYAYQIRSDHEHNPTRVFTPHWTHGDNSMTTSKTNSSILFKDDKTFFSFGFQAEQDFCDLCMGTLDGYEESNYRDWYFFRAFKTQLYRENAEDVHHSMTLRDVSGKTMKALDVYTAAIRYMKETAFIDVTNRRMKDTLRERDIKWVVTVPAIWNDSAKQFVRLACEKAGMIAENVILSLEPEAAIISCKEFMLEQNRQDNLQLLPFDRGSSFMVLDLGGKTAEIMVYRVEDDHKVRELHKASVDDCGGENVDSEFTDFWINVLGKQQYKDIEERTPDEILDLQTRFQSIKRQIQPSQSSYWMTVPDSLMLTSDFEENISRIHDGRITLRRGKVNIPLMSLEEMFNEPISNLIGYLKRFFCQQEHQDVETVLMVGGLSESMFIQERIRSAFSYKTVVIPDQGSIAILRGAAMLGFKTRDAFQAESVGIPTAFNTSESKGIPTTLKTSESKGIPTTLKTSESKGIHAALKTSESEGIHAALKTSESEGIPTTLKTSESEGIPTTLKTSESEGIPTTLKTSESEGIPTTLKTSESEGIPTTLKTSESEGIPTTLKTSESEGIPTTLKTSESEGIPTTLKTSESEGIPTTLKTSESEGIPTTLKTSESEGIPTTLKTSESEGIPTALKTSESKGIPTTLKTPESEGIPTTLKTSESERIPTALKTSESEGIPTTLKTSESEGIPSILKTSESEGVPSTLKTSQSEGIPTALKTSESKGIPTELKTSESEGVSTALKTSECLTLSVAPATTDTQSTARTGVRACMASLCGRATGCMRGTCRTLSNNMSRALHRTRYYNL